MKKMKVFVLGILMLFAMVACDGEFSLPGGLTLPTDEITYTGDLTIPNDLTTSDFVTGETTTETRTSISTDDTSVTTIIPSTSEGSSETTEIPQTTERPETTVHTEVHTGVTTSEGQVIERIYFYNGSSWDKVMAYAWNEEGDLLGAWPGVMTTQEEDSQWWFIDVDIDLEISDLNIVFNDGGDLQTPDVLIESSDFVYVNPLGEVYANKEDTINTLQDHYIWFYNSQAWDQVYAYAWIDGSEFLGGWPGALAIQEENSNWWKVNVPYDPSVTPFNIIFNNNGNQQTADLWMDSSLGVYVTMTGVYESIQAAEEAVSSPQTTRVYFYNTEGWEDVYAYAFDKDGHQLLGNWNGQAAIQEEASNWWYIDVGVDSQITPFTIIFNSDMNQTGDIDIQGSYVYVTPHGVYESKSQAEASLNTTRVWFYNSQDWAEVYAYVQDSDFVEVFGEDPGKMALQENESRWWYIDVPVDINVSSIFINFNDGLENQSPNVKITNDWLVYVTVDGQVNASKNLAESLISSSDQITIYFWNYDEWENLHAYVVSANGILTDDWPGTRAKPEESTNWWSITVPVNPSEEPIHVYFNNGAEVMSGDAYVDNQSDVYMSIPGGSYSSKEDLVNALSVTSTIWFYNSGGWSDVAAWIYGESGSLLGEWPGQSAIQGNDSDWYYIEIPVDVTKFPISISFNNNDLEYYQQSVDVDIDSNHVYVGLNGHVAGSKAEIESFYNVQTRIYFYNSEGWNRVFAYAYDEDGYDYLGMWPGVEASQTDDPNWLYIDIPTDPTSDPVYLIFNNAMGTESPAALIVNQNDIFMTIDGELFTSEEEAEASMTTAEVTTIFFYNSAGWETVNAYIWDEQSSLTEWPGMSASQIDHTSWWSIDLTINPNNTPFNIIFNNGVDQQTPDVLISDTSFVYIDIEGEIFDSKSTLEDKYKTPTETTTLYFYNSQAWTTVNVYVYGDQGELLGAWPGSSAIKEEASDWWLIDVGVDTAIENINIIFNGDGQQSPSIFINDSVHKYATYLGNTYESKSSAVDSLNATTTLYFYNDQGWSHVNAFAYLEAESNIVFLDGWPGTPMSDTNMANWWSINVNVDTSVNPIIIIFNDGNNQTDNIRVDSQSHVYITSNGGTYNDASTAEDGAAGLLTTTIYYYNSQGFDTVYALAWDENGNDLLAPFPGTAMTQEEGTDWWMIEVNVDAAIHPFNISFGDQSGPQTIPAVIDNLTHVYINKFGNRFESKLLTEESLNVTSRIYFYNSDGWDEVYGYVILAIEELTGPMPGQLATQDGSSDWFYIDVDVDISMNPIAVTFHDNDTHLGYEVYIDSEVGTYVTPEGQVYKNKEAAEKAMIVTTTVWFYNDLAWDNLYAYAYDDDGDLLGPSPGISLTQDDSDMVWWSVDVTTDATSFTIIIKGEHDNSSVQTAETMIDSIDEMYMNRLGGEAYMDAASAIGALPYDG